MQLMLGNNTLNSLVDIQNELSSRNQAEANNDKRPGKQSKEFDSASIEKVREICVKMGLKINE